jgi:serine/threonine-protein kinase
VKPGNVLITRTGALKLLDFGLARIAEQREVGPAAASTVAAAGGPALTQIGAALGTWQYMSPEQIRGEPADARSDVFALGAVIYEMLSGRRPFDRNNQHDTIAAVLEDDPEPLRGIEARVPPAVEKVVHTCLAKDPDERWQAADHVRQALDVALAAGEAPRVRRPRLPVYAAAAVAALLLAALAAVAWFAPGRIERPTGRTIRSVIALPDKVTAAVGSGTIAFAPDGSSIFYRPRDPQAELRRYRLADGVDTVVAGTAGAEAPFFSPDGQWLGFFAGNFLKKVSINGGTPTNLCPVQSSWGGSWGADGFIVFSHVPETGLFRVPDSGGTPELITRLAPEDAGNDHRFPEVLPGGQTILYSVATGPEDTARIVAANLRTGERHELIQGAASARFVAPDHIAYARNGNLFASPFSLERLEITGPPQRLASGVAESTDGAPEFAFSGTGDLVYMSGGGTPENRLMLIALDGVPTLIEGPPQFMLRPRVSPDGGTVAYYVGAAKNNVWLYDMERGTTTRRTFGRFHEPVWRPDGRLSVSEGGPGLQKIVLLSRDGSGSDEMLVEEGPAFPESWSPDGGTLVYRVIQPQAQWNLWALTMADRQRRALFPSPFNQRNARFSPDGRWLAYVSNETGRDELYVRSVEDGGRTPISNGGAQMAAWTPDGRRLYYRDLADGMWVVDVASTPQFKVTRPRLVFRVPDLGFSFDLTADGTRFVAIKLDPRPAPTHLQLVLNPLSATADDRRPGPTTP